jgi:hypothetical protein
VRFGLDRACAACSFVDGGYIERRVAPLGPLQSLRTQRRHTETSELGWLEGRDCAVLGKPCL